MTILANISSLEHLLLCSDMSPEELHQADLLLAAIRHAVIQLAPQQFPHNKSASTPDVASAVLLPG